MVPVFLYASLTETIEKESPAMSVVTNAILQSDDANPGEQL